MLSESLKNLMLWLEQHKADNGSIHLSPNDAALVTGQLGGLWHDAMELERAAVPDSRKQPEVAACNNGNVVRIDHYKALKGDAA